MKIFKKLSLHFVLLSLITLWVECQDNSVAEALSIEEIDESAEIFAFSLRKKNPELKKWYDTASKEDRAEYEALCRQHMTFLFLYALSKECANS